MKTFSLSFITDTLFVAVACFLILLVFGGYFIPYPFSLIFAVCVALLITLLAVKWFTVKRGKKAFSASEEKEYFNFITRINFMAKAEVYKLFSRSAKAFGLSIEKDGSYCFIPQKNVRLVWFFGYENPEKKDIVKLFNRLTKNQKGVIIAEGFTSPIIEFSARFDGRIKLVDGREIYTSLKETQALPDGEVPFSNSPEAFSKRRIGFNLLNKKRAKNYLVFGIAFLLLSYFAPLKLYYVICGCAMLILSLITRLLGKVQAPD